MAISLTHHVTDDSNVAATSKTTATFTPSADRLLIACYVAMRTDATQPTDPTVSGGNLTWAQQHEQFFSTAGNRDQMWIYAADTGEGGASLSNMAVTFDHDATTHQGFLWSVFSLDGTDLASSGGSSTVAECFIQFVDGPVNSVSSPLSITLAAAADSGNRPFLSGFAATGSQDLMPQTNWTQIGESGGIGTPVFGELMTQWRSDAFDTAAAMTWATGDVRKGGIAFEVAVLGAPPTGAAIDPFGMMGFFGA